MFLKITTLVQSPIQSISGLISQYAHFKASYKRLTKILNLPETIELVQADDNSLMLGAVEVNDGQFCWKDIALQKILEEKNVPKTQQIILDNISIKIRQGTMVAIIGQVGSGKSSLLYAMNNQMFKTKGKVSKNGKTAFVSQEPFMMNATIRENILFGEEYDEKEYQEILKICELVQDLDILEGKDMTEIGVKGINLSGGQKQRIQIARAIYSNADIYYIDDTLSALDAHVGKAIFENVFNKKLKGKTIIFTTHATQYLPLVDKVYLMVKGEIILSDNV